MSTQENLPTSTDCNITQTQYEPIELHVYQQGGTPVDDGTVSLKKIHNTVSEEVDSECVTNCANVTLKSYDCDGGEVEVSDEIVGKADDTIPLPQPGISYSQHVLTLDSSNILDCTDYTEEETPDHVYCRRESGTASDTSTMEHLQNKPCDPLDDMTLKFLNCSGGEIEITDSVHSVDRTIPLPSDLNESCVKSHNEDVDSILFTEDCDVDHLDHPYCNSVRAKGSHATNHPKVLNEDVQSNSKHKYKEAVSIFTLEPAVECSNGNSKEDKASSMSLEPSSPKPLATDIILKQTNYLNEEAASRESVIEMREENDLMPTDVSRSSNANQSENDHEHDMKDNCDLDVRALTSLRHSSNDHHTAILEPPRDVKDQDESHDESPEHSNIQPHQDRDTADSALGLSPNAPVSAKTPQAEPLHDIFKAITECTPLHLKYLTPVVRRASLALMQAQSKLLADPFVGDNWGQVRDKSVVAPDLDHAEFWREHLDSPMSRPLLNSTELVHRAKPCTVAEPPKEVTLPQPEVDNKQDMDIPVISELTLQQQLRQMAEFLLLASGKMGPSPASAPVIPTANACVGTSPLKLVNHSINTSGQFERRKSISVEDQCTLTDPLLWNVPVGSLQSVSKLELEQRVLSSMIVVEALVQQLAAARAHTLPPAGAAPSTLRDKTVQTEHTELNQTSIHRDLYLEALNRIQELEIHNTSLQNLAQYIPNVKRIMTSLTSDTDAALCQMKQIENVVREDHNGLVSNYVQMKSLLEKSRESQERMVLKVKDALQQKEDMHTKMQEAFAAKEAAYSVMEQLRKHCSVEISELEKCVGSQQELWSALKKATPEQAALNEAYTETLNCATELLSKTTEEQATLAKELCTVRDRLQKCTPILLKLNEKANTALRERDTSISERDQALEDKEQTEEELNQALQNLQAAKGQISDLNLQVTILTSEMGVLRQKLSESDEERTVLDRKSTELSAIVSSTLASYAFLEQALASETTKLQQSWADLKEARERAQELDVSLVQSEQRVAELSEALACREEQVSHLQGVSETQTLQLQQLQDMCSQLSGVRDMNEFLQMENELSREQITESERLLRGHLQSLRERNIQCEDLNQELRQIQHENQTLQEELDCIRTKFTASQTEHKEKLEQIVTEIAILHHTVRSVTNELHTSLKEKNPEQPTHSISSSVADCDVVALTSEKERSPKKDAPVQSELVFSETSAFTRITAVTPKKSLSTKCEAEEQQQQSNVSEVLVGLDSTFTELRNALTSVQQLKDALLKDKDRTICRLQRELEAAHSSHQTQVSELQFELSRQNARMDKINVSLQQKTQNEKTVSKLVAEISEIQEMLNKHKADNNELRREVAELRRSLQQAKSEAHFLHDELSKNSGHSAPPANFMEEKIALLKEMERLKMNHHDEEQARKKLLDRAKRHQAIYETNQQKSEKELQLLNNMLNKVRETLLSLPVAVRNCEQLQQLMEYVG